jgi:hypothetical protein
MITVAAIRATHFLGTGRGGLLQTDRRRVLFVIRVNHSLAIHDWLDDTLLALTFAPQLDRQFHFIPGAIATVVAAVWTRSHKNHSPFRVRGAGLNVSVQSTAAKVAANNLAISILWKNSPALNVRAAENAIAMSVNQNHAIAVGLAANHNVTDALSKRVFVFASSHTSHVPFG